MRNGDREVMEHVQGSEFIKCDGCASVLSHRARRFRKGAFLFCERCRLRLGGSDMVEVGLGEELAPEGEGAVEGPQEAEEKADPIPEEALRQLPLRVGRPARPKALDEGKGDGTFYEGFRPMAEALARGAGKLPMKRGGLVEREQRDEGEEMKKGSHMSEEQRQKMSDSVKAGIARSRGTLAAVSARVQQPQADHDAVACVDMEVNPMVLTSTPPLEELKPETAAAVVTMGMAAGAASRAAAKLAEKSVERAEMATESGVTFAEVLRVRAILKRMTAYERAVLMEMIEGR